MYKSIDEYLNRLSRELKGCDRALIQDAVSDAEEHIVGEMEDLRDKDPEISELEALRTAIEKYGDISEISQDYRKLESEYVAFFTSPSIPDRNWFQKFFLIIADPAAWTALRLEATSRSHNAYCS